MSRIDAIQRFLSLPPDDRSPLSLLNITIEQCEMGLIDAALQRRLDRVARHPEASTPDADTVRMALHTAAAQLADAAVRSRILSEQSETVGASDATSSTTNEPAAPAPTHAPPIDRQALLTFRRTAVRTILLCRGWNRKSRRMLAAVAGASGIAPEHMAIALRSLSGPISAGAAPAAAPTPVAPAKKQTFFESLHEKPAKAQGVPSSVILGIGGGIAAAAILTIVTIRLLTPGPAPDSASADDTLAPIDHEPAITRRDDSARTDRSDADREIDIPDPTGAVPSRTVQEPPDPAGLVRTLRRCVELASTDPGEAAWRLEQAISTLSSSWSMLEPATIEAANDAVIVFLIEAPAGGESGRRALSAVAAGARQQASADRLNAFEVAPAVWSCGALAELLTAPGAPIPVQEYAREVLSAAVGSFDTDHSAGFVDGATASLAAMAQTLSTFDAGRDSLAAWGRWRESLLAATGALSPDDMVLRRELETIDAIEVLMRSGPSLAQRPEVYGELTALLETLRWAPDAASGHPTPARLALLRWFDDLSIETEDLALVTEWIVRESGTPGVGIQMTLRRNAGVEGRAAQRDKYASVWSLGDGVGADELATNWTRAALRSIDPDRNPSADIVGALIRAAEHGRLSEAGARRWRRETTAAQLIMNDPFASIVDAAKPTSRQGTLENAGGRRDGAWALEYLGAGNADEQKFAAISRLELWGGSIGRIDGDVLARAALLGSPIEVRTAAQRTVRKRADEPAVINGLLESIGVAPRNSSTRALIESVTSQSLPSPRNPAWPHASRLALTEQLLEMLAGRTGLSAIDRIAQVMTDSYLARAAYSGTTMSQNAQTPEKAGRLLWTEWRDEAGRVIGTPRASRSLEMIDRRRRGRLTLATGPVQRFAAEQSSVAEVMGYVIASERPSRAEDVRAILDRLGTERRSVATIFEQIEATERAMLMLWMIRFGEAVPGFENQGADSA